MGHIDPIPDVHFKRTFKAILIVSAVLMMMVSVIPLPVVDAAEPTISIMNPDGGEEIIAGSTVSISWQISGTGGFVTAELSTDGGSSFEELGTVANDPFMGAGSMRWEVPPVLNSSSCRIRLIWRDGIIKPYDTYDTDVSDSNFTIEPGVTLEFTDEPELTTYGKYYRWDYKMYDPDGLVKGLKFKWKYNNGSGWTSWQPLPGSYDWMDPGRNYLWWSPSYIESGYGQIRVEAYSQGNTTMWASAVTDVFEVVSPGVTIIQPDGGVTLIPGTSYTIKWRTSEDPEQIIADVWIRYSTNGGSTWTSIGFHDNDFEYDWVVPNEPTEQLRVQVISMYGEHYAYADDESSHDNRIISGPSVPSVTLEEPNPPVEGGLWLVAGEIEVIRYSLTGTNNIDSLVLSYSTDNGTSFTGIRTITSGFGVGYAWTVPAVDTNEGLVRIEMSSTTYPDQTVTSNHPFYIFDERTVNRAPIAGVARKNLHAVEGDRIMLDATPSYDPDLDPLTFDWTLDQPSPVDVHLFNSTTARPYFYIELTSYPVDLVFHLKVEDGYDHSNETFTYDTEAISVHIEPRPPELTRQYPDTGWPGTTFQLEGSDLKGADILFNGISVGRVATGPVAGSPYPDIRFNFTVTEDIDPGVYEVSVSTLAGNSTLGETIEIFPEPQWQLDHGLGFSNNNTKVLSYPWNPWGEGRYKGVFGNQVYLTLWICIGLPYWTPWDGWKCEGYKIEEPYAPDPLAAIFYGAVFHHIAKEGECFGMSSTALKHYHGDLTVAQFGQQGKSELSELDRTGELKRYIQEHQGAQMSAEVLNVYLDSLIDGLIPSSEMTGMGPLISEAKYYIDNEDLGILTMICDEGAHAVVPYAYEDTGDKVRFYVYDPNREPFSVEGWCDQMALIGNDPYDNPPYVDIDRSGVYWDWSFEWTDGTEWSSPVGLAYVPYDVVNGDRTLPMSVEGIFQLMAGSASCSMEDDQGNSAGVAENGSIMWDIPEAAPLPIFGGEGHKPSSYFLPEGNYTTSIRGTEDGNYNWSTINNGTSAFSIEDADVKKGSNDTVSVDYTDGNPYLGAMTYGSDDDMKVYNASIVHQYGSRFRKMRIIGSELNDDGEHGDGRHFMRVNDDYSGFIFENQGGGPTTFDVRFRTNVMSEDVWNGTDRPGIGYLPTATRSGITVEPGESVEIKATDWLNLNNSLVILGTETVPGEVLNLAINKTGGQIEIYWEPPVETGGWPVTEYQILRGEDPGNMTMIGATSETSFVDNDTERGVTYHYSVKAVNAIGAGDMIEPVSMMILMITAPGAVQNLFGEYSDGEILLTWDPPEDNGGSEITGYSILRGTSSGDLAVVEDVHTGAGYVDLDILANTTYYYQVAALNSEGQGILSEEISVEVPAEQPPPDDDDDDTGDEEDDDDPWMMYLLIIIAAVILLIIVAALVVASNRKEGLEE